MPEKLGAWAGGLMSSWSDTKEFLEESVFSSDSLHVLIGVLLLFAAALLLRRPISSWLPWLAVLALTCLNEVVDLTIEQWPERTVQYGESAKDVLTTMILPTLLMLSARFLPHLYRQRR